jgi:creatinine amidohydrolase
MHSRSNETEAADSAWLRLSAGAVTDRAAGVGSVLVVPVGSTEQHGPHLPTGTDTLLVDAACQAAVARVEDELPVVLAPPVWTGFSPHHRAFGGTISPPHAVLRRYLHGIGAAAIPLGFDAVLYVNGHGGNGPLVGSVVSTLGAAQSDAEVLGVTYFDLAAPVADELRESDVGGMAHGGEFESSLMLYLYPDLVDAEALASVDPVYRDEPYEWAGREMFDAGPLSVYRPFDVYSESGVLGDPTLASAEKGEALHDWLIAELETLLRGINAGSG